jgi:hypothetical protein
MEAIAIGEVQNAPHHHRNRMIIFMKTLGICTVDEQYTDNGDNVLDANEARSLMKLEDFDFSSCDRFLWTNLMYMFMHGAAFRSVAWLVLLVGTRNKHV